MQELTELFRYFRDHKTAILTTALGMFAGAFCGVLAYYYSWLG